MDNPGHDFRDDFARAEFTKNADRPYPRSPLATRLEAIDCTLGNVVNATTNHANGLAALAEIAEQAVGNLGGVTQELRTLEHRAHDQHHEIKNLRAQLLAAAERNADVLQELGSALVRAESLGNARDAAEVELTRLRAERLALLKAHPTPRKR